MYEANLKGKCYSENESLLLLPRVMYVVVLRTSNGYTAIYELDHHIDNNNNTWIQLSKNEDYMVCGFIPRLVQNVHGDINALL